MRNAVKKLGRIDEKVAVVNYLKKKKISKFSKPRK
jgi:hypothetical protein